uniref:Uncharacterized protein n=1 Tax=Oryzias latipes TaxID=8090 RepID=H2LCT3_ORYLA
MLQSVMRLFYISLFLLYFGACVPLKKSETSLGSGFSYSSPGFGSDYSGRGSSIFGYDSRGDFGSGSPRKQAAGFDRFIAEILSLRPSRSFPRRAWTSNQVPLGMVEPRPVFPSSHVVRTSNGYQRARDFRSDAKYAQDIFDHIDEDGQQEGHQATGPTGQKTY